jgi:tRNA modification GTPase
VFSTDDSIVAIATPPGRGGIGIVRISGPAALDVAAALLQHSRPLQPRHATFTRVVPAASPARDEVVATYFPAPHSYTGEEVVEISAHGSPVVLHAIVTGAIAAGARLAEPGEFTLRAFLNGKRDLIQAEAVADLIDAATPLQARAAFDQLEGTLTRQIGEIDRDLFDLVARLEASLDFPDEGYHFIEPDAVAQGIRAVICRVDQLLETARRGRLIREGVTIVIVGRPNVGKSSVFNRLVGSDRAIVTEVAGTTRDLVTERIAIDGLSVTLVDTAGARRTTDAVEREGVERAQQARAIADLLLVVLDAGDGVSDADDDILSETATRRRIVVSNKTDLATPKLGIGVSAATGHGFDDLRRAIVRELVGQESLRDCAAITNVRHIALLEQARHSLDEARYAAAHARASEEFVVADLQAARMRLDEVVGRRTSDDVLKHIFDRFCIGK